MTVRYNSVIEKAGRSTFIRLVFKWRGSVWKSIGAELLVWMCLFALISFSYRYLLNEEHRRTFEAVVVIFNKYSNFLPLTFMLGFFVRLVVDRWWEQWCNIGFIDGIGLFVIAHIPGDDPRARMFRRGIIRYMLLLQIMILRNISELVMRRFPTLETLIAAGYVTKDELERYLATPTTYTNYFTASRWAMNLAVQARVEGHIRSDVSFNDLVNKINDYRCQLGVLTAHDFVPVPLSYTQVVCLTVRLYFLICLIGRQYIAQAPEPGFVEPLDLKIPIITVFEFILYMGWAKVAEELLNPFGSDDDDLEINWLIDRNFQVGLILADQSDNLEPVQDVNWNNPSASPNQDAIDLLVQRMAVEAKNSVDGIPSLISANVIGEARSHKRTIVRKRTAIHPSETVCACGAPRKLTSGSHNV